MAYKNRFDKQDPEDIQEIRYVLTGTEKLRWYGLFFILLMAVFVHFFRDQEVPWHWFLFIIPLYGVDEYHRRNPRVVWRGDEITITYKFFSFTVQNQIIQIKDITRIYEREQLVKRINISGYGYEYMFAVIEFKGQTKPCEVELGRADVLSGRQFLVNIERHNPGVVDSKFLNHVENQYQAQIQALSH